MGAKNPGHMQGSSGPRGLRSTGRAEAGVRPAARAGSLWLGAGPLPAPRTESTGRGALWFSLGAGAPTLSGIFHLGLCPHRPGLVNAPPQLPRASVWEAESQEREWGKAGLGEALRGATAPALCTSLPKSFRGAPRAVPGAAQPSEASFPRLLLLLCVLWRLQPPDSRRCLLPATCGAHWLPPPPSVSPLLPRDQAPAQLALQSLPQPGSPRYRAAPQTGRQGDVRGEIQEKEGKRGRWHHQCRVTESGCPG